MALGITNFVVSLGITAVLGRVARVRVYLGLPLVLATSLALQRVVLAFDIPWTYAVFWLLMNVEGLLQGMLTWGIASIVCDTRQAKRLFPLFAAGGIFGGVVGGFVTRPLAALLGTENLLAIWSGSLVLVFLVARTLLARHVVAPARGASLLQDMQAGYRYVRSSPLWRDVSAATVPFAVLYFSLAFPFPNAATPAYPSPQQPAGCSSATERSTRARLPPSVLARHSSPRTSGGVHRANTRGRSCERFGPANRSSSPARRSHSVATDATPRPPRQRAPPRGIPIHERDISRSRCWVSSPSTTICSSPRSMTTMTMCVVPRRAHSRATRRPSCARTWTTSIPRCALPAPPRCSRSSPEPGRRSRRCCARTMPS